MKSGENKASDLFESLGYKPERFTKIEMKSGRTPDFKVYDGENLAFYCEEKTFLDCSGFYDDFPTDEIRVGIEKGSTKSNRLVHQSREAIKQFKAVNPEHVIPNIIVILNHDETFFPDEIVELLQGYAYINGDVTTHYIPTTCRERISDELHWIDAFIVLHRIKETGEIYNRFYYQNNSAQQHKALRNLIERYK